MKGKKILKPVIFLALLLVIEQCIVGILKKPVNEQWDASGLSYVYGNKGIYDVVFSGTSMTLTNVNIQELYSEYGIGAVTVGEPSQSTFLSYYTLEETMKYQSPKVVLFDVNSLFYPDDDLAKDLKNEYHYIHYSLDGMKNNLTKYRALQQAKEINPKLDMWNYFSPMYYSHANWESIAEENFIRKSGANVLNGNVMLLTVNENYPNGRTTAVQSVENTGEAKKIPEVNYKYLMKMIDLCREHEAQLVLLRSGGAASWDWLNYNAIDAVAKEYEIPYLDVNVHEEEIGFDWRYDMSDHKHFNIGGAKKWTDYVGAYLKEHYDLPDRRGDKAFAYLEQNQAKYESALNAVRDKQSLLAATDFNSYLDALLTVDREDNVIFFVAVDEVSEKITEEQLGKIRQLGLAAGLEDKYRCSYLGVAESGANAEKLSEKGISIAGTMSNGAEYRVYSGGHATMSKASAVIDGTEYISGQRGMNIVVYNKAMKEVLSSVFFDTHAEENPQTARAVQAESVEYAVEKNVWETAE